MGGKSSKKKQVEELEQPPPSARAQEYQTEENVQQEDVYQQKSSGIGLLYNFLRLVTSLLIQNFGQKKKTGILET